MMIVQYKKRTKKFLQTTQICCNEVMVGTTIFTRAIFNCVRAKNQPKSDYHSRSSLVRAPLGHCAGPTNQPTNRPIVDTKPSVQHGRLSGRASRDGVGKWAKQSHNTAAKCTPSLLHMHSFAFFPVLFYLMLSGKWGSFFVCCYMLVCFRSSFRVKKLQQCLSLSIAYQVQQLLSYQTYTQTQQ